MELAYVSESYDGDVHFLNATFHVTVRPSTALRGFAQDSTTGGDHVVGVEWVPLDELAQRIVVGVVREPLLAYLRGTFPQRYAGYHDAGVTIEWPADSR